MSLKYIFIAAAGVSEIIYALSALTLCGLSNSLTSVLCAVIERVCCDDIQNRKQYIALE